MMKIYVIQARMGHYLAYFCNKTGREGMEDWWWVDDPAKAMRFLNRNQAKRYIELMDVAKRHEDVKAVCVTIAEDSKT